MNANFRKNFFTLKQIKIAFSQIRGRFNNRTDTEHEQAFIRLIIGILLFFYFIFANQTQAGLDNSISNSLLVTGIFILITIGIIVHIATFPRASIIRRLIASTLDSITITSFFF